MEAGVRLGGVPAPTAVIHGAHDPFLPLSSAKRLQQAINGATLDVLDASRHFLPEESPERLAKIITALIEK